MKAFEDQGDQTMPSGPPPDRFLVCTADMLREEEGHDQPVGGPYIRGRYAYSDDPHDSGGKTMMGILQREYTAWRNRQGLPDQWVKNISDDELNLIYRAQYWEASRAGELPAGIDLLTYDMSVNCGVGTSAKRLQMALGVKVDGHIGQVTLDAAREADPLELIEKFTALRERYHRGCKSFPYHGKNWLERTARIADKAVHYSEFQTQEPAAYHPDWQTTVVDEREFTGTARAVMSAPSSMAQSTTGHAAIGIGSSGAGVIGVAAGKAAAHVSAYGKAALFSTHWFVLFVFQLMQTFEFWVGVNAVVGAVYIWLERRRHIQEPV